MILFHTLYTGLNAAEDSADADESQFTLAPRVSGSSTGWHGHQALDHVGDTGLGPSSSATHTSFPDEQSMLGNPYEVMSLIMCSYIAEIVMWVAGSQRRGRDTIVVAFVLAGAQCLWL
jgi:hypothetical protein